MFEKEANLHASIMAWDGDVDTWETIAERSFQQGAEFGYNKGKVETALLSQHILDLQKDKGNLTDKVRELEQQIEKMKRCYTCKHHTGLGYCKLKQNNGVCENHDKWEFGENDRR